MTQDIGDVLGSKVDYVLNELHQWLVNKKNTADILRVAEVGHYFNNLFCSKNPNRALIFLCLTFWKSILIINLSKRTIQIVFINTLIF